MPQAPANFGCGIFHVTNVMTVIATQPRNTVHITVSATPKPSMKIGNAE
jgi:hypothetical protein